MTETELKHWARSCLSKRRYMIQAQAEAAAASRSRKVRIKLSSYYCGYCCGYHLTKQPQYQAVPA